MKVSKVGDWEKAQRRLGKLAKDLGPAMERAVNLEALYLVAAIKTKLRTGPFEPLAGTAAQRRRGGRKGSKPLLNSGALRDSVSFVQEGKEAFVGILRSATGHGGKAANIGAIHENGATVIQVMTTKQRRFLFGVLFKGKRAAPAKRFVAGPSGLLVIRIPPRPFIRPVYEAEGKTFQARFTQRLLRLLKLE